MPQQRAHERFQLGNRLQVSWRTIVVFAAVLAFADAFWMVTLRGAVGAIEHTQEPFSMWLRESTLLVPVYAGAIVLALLAARRWFVRRQPARLAPAIAALVLATTIVGVGVTAATAAIDYRSQAAQLGLLHTFHSPTTPRTAATGAPAPLASCDALCKARQETIGAHVRGVRYVSVLLLGTNLVLAVWLVALRGGRLWSVPRRRRPALGSGADQLEPALA